MGKFEKSAPKIDFPKGGDGKMFGKGGTRPAEAGVSGKSTNEGSGGDWAKGGSGKMFGKGTANKAEPGQSGKSSQ